MSKAGNGSRSRGARFRTGIVLGAATAASGFAISVSLGAARIFAASPAAPSAGVSTTAAAAASNRPLTEDEKILQVLNRFAFGPRPGDVQRVKKIGLSAYIEMQLHPERIDDSAVDQKLSSLQYLNTSGEDLATMYAGQVDAFKESQKLRKEATRDKAADENKPAPNAAGGAAMSTAATADAAAKTKRELINEASPEDRKMLAQKQMELREKAMPVIMAQRQLAMAKMIRATESQRQLQEVMVDFWGNHFNIDVRKAACGPLKVADDRDVIRKNALARFRDLLGASAHSPAMLVYLDNFQSVSPDVEYMIRQRMGNRFDQMPPARKQALLLNAKARLAEQKGKGQARGINENYAREIMELHTLGVDGGYSQKDVQEVARCFTGWGLEIPESARQGGKYAIGGVYQFHPAQHDNGEKIVLGHVIPAGGGEKDGEMVLDILASQPATMKHVSWQLCERLVSDTPPESLVNKCVATWKKTDGDVREILRTILTSPEFYSRSAYRQKIKSPLEYAVSSVRALDGSVVQPRLAGLRERNGNNPKKGNALENLANNSLLGQVGLMGEPIFQYQAPTGYPEDSRKWVSSGALISRLNFSLALTGGKLIEVSLPNLEQTVTRSDDPSRLVNSLAQEIVQTDISPSTRATLLREVGPAADPASTAADVSTVSRLAALMLGSPEFQRR